MMDDEEVVFTRKLVEELLASLKLFKLLLLSVAVPTLVDLVIVNALVFSKPVKLAIFKLTPPNIPPVTLFLFGMITCGCKRGVVAGVGKGVLLMGVVLGLAVNELARDNKFELTSSGNGEDDGDGDGTIWDCGLNKGVLTQDCTGVLTLDGGIELAEECGCNGVDGALSMVEVGSNGAKVVMMDEVDELAIVPRTEFVCVERVVLLAAAVAASKVIAGEE